MWRNFPHGKLFLATKRSVGLEIFECGSALLHHVGADLGRADLLCDSTVLRPGTIWCNLLFGIVIDVRRLERLDWILRANIFKNLRSGGGGQIEHVVDYGWRSNYGRYFIVTHQVDVGNEMSLMLGTTKYLPQYMPHLSLALYRWSVASLILVRFHPL